MHKSKPNKGLLKRVTVSANGKVRYKRIGGNHLMSGKSGDSVRSIRKKNTVTGKLNTNYLRGLRLDKLNKRLRRLKEADNGQS